MKLVMKVAHDTDRFGGSTPRPNVERCDLNFNVGLIEYNTQSRDVGVKIGTFFAKNAKSLILDAIEGPLSGMIPTFANNAILDLKEEYQGELGRDLISIALNLLPAN